jgi:hypothetical protein
MVSKKAKPVKAGFKTVFKSKDLASKILLVLGNAPGHTTVGLTHVHIQNEYLSNTTI